MSFIYSFIYLFSSSVIYLFINIYLFIYKNEHKYLILNNTISTRKWFFYLKFFFIQFFLKVELTICQWTCSNRFFLFLFLFFFFFCQCCQSFDKCVVIAKTNKNIKKIIIFNSTNNFLLIKKNSNLSRSPSICLSSTDDKDRQQTTFSLHTITLEVQSVRLTRCDRQLTIL